MGSNKFFYLLVCFVLSGCATTSQKHSISENNSIYSQGYKDGVRENINSIVEKLNENDFPYYGNWSEPIVQNVKVPASIQNGVFIPEHYQVVLIKPGEWKKNQAYPIKAEKMEKKDDANNLQNLSSDVNDITDMPKQYSVKSTETK